MRVLENKEALRWHLVGFSNMYEYKLKEDPHYPVAKMAEDYLNDQITMEKGMDEYYECLKKIAAYNDRILKAIKSVRGKTFYNHLVSFIKDAEACDHEQFEIISKPIGEEQSVSEYGRFIKKEWVQQWSIGDSGDSFHGTICVEIKPNKYLKFSYSM